MIHFEDFIMQDEADKYNMLQECNAYIKSKDKEIERLNNIINELEKWLNEEYDATIFDYRNAIEDVIDKLIELKGVDKE